MCEGKNTEPDYFNALADTNTKVMIKTVGGVGVPLTVAKKAVEQAKILKISPKARGKKDSYEKNDPVWAVIDRDEHPNYEEAVELCESHRVRVGRSNPCFEVWLILHYEDYEKPNNSNKVQAQLQNLESNYDPDRSKTFAFSVLADRVEIAEQRADKQLRNREDEGAPNGNPSTTVGHLTKAIRKASNAAS